jgi:hypothetical protein
MFLLFLSPGLTWYCIRGPRCAAGEFKLFQHKKFLLDDNDMRQTKTQYEIRDRNKLQKKK